MSELRAALIGLSSAGTGVLRAARKAPGLQVCAVADHHRTHDPDAPQWSEAKYYEDPRTLLLSEKLDLVMIALPPFAATDYVNLAIETGVPIWQTAPPFCNTATAQRVAQKCSDHQILFTVDRLWQDEAGYQALIRAIDQIGDIRHGQIAVRQEWFDGTSWKQDLNKSGGGVMLYCCYSVLELLVALLGGAKQVFAATQESHLRRHEPESSCSAVLSHGRGFEMTLSAAESSVGPPFELTLMAQNGTIIVDDASFRQFDRHGALQEHVGRHCATAHLESLNALIRQLEKHSPALVNTTESHLETIATIEAAYLSMRTHQPERACDIRRIHQTS